MSISFTSIYPAQVVDEVNRRVDIRELMKRIDYKFDKYQDSPKTVKCYCPIHGEELFRNLIIDKEQRTFRCLYTQCAGSDGGNLVQLFALARKIPFDEALRELVQSQKLGTRLLVDEETVKASLTQAEDLLNQGDMEGAEQLYRQVIEGEPNDIAANLGLLYIYAASGVDEKRWPVLNVVAPLLLEQGRITEIADDVKAWADASPDDANARLAIAQVTLEEGDAENAVMEFMAAADSFESIGNPHGAASAYLRVEEISREHNLDLVDATPHVVRSLLNSGRDAEATQYLLKKVDEADKAGDSARVVDLLNSMLDLDPDSTLLRSRFVEAAAALPPMHGIVDRILESSEFFFQREDHDLAITALRTYVEKAPENEEPLVRLIDAMYTHGQPAEAADMEARLAERYHTYGRSDEASELVQKILQWQPDHVGSLGVLALLEQATGNTAAAREARRRQAKSLTGRREYEAASQILDEMLAAEPDAADILEQQAINLESAVQAGNRQYLEKATEALSRVGMSEDSTSSRRSLHFLERAVALGGASPQLHFEVASAYMRKKEMAKARDNIILGCEALAGDGELDAAVLEAERFAELMPVEADLIRYLAELYLRVG